MRIGLYPGSFNPWHEGHSDILRKASYLFDQVIVCTGRNPDKTDLNYDIEKLCDDFKDAISWKNVIVDKFDGLLADYAKKVDASAIIRGLRNGHDLQYEMNQQYWNEDLGLTVPIIYFICDRKLSHISSSAIRSLKNIQRK